MSREAIEPLAIDLVSVAHTGADHGSLSRLSRHAAALNALSGRDDAYQPLAEAAQRTMSADVEEVPLPLLDLLQRTMQERTSLTQFASTAGDLKDIPEGGYWATPMPAELLYTLVPETRPFAKRAKAPEQIDNIEKAARRGQIADLRLVQVFLKMLTEKTGNTVGDTVARVAIPAYGPVILPDLWPSLAPENRTFIAAYKIDVEATLARLLDKTGKKSDKGGNVMKAVEKLMTTVNEDGSSIGPESLPIIKLALKHAPDQSFRRKLADILAFMGSKASEALPDLIDAFEHTGLTRDYYLIRPIVVLGKESQDVADTVIRAMGDRDHVVRLMASFNLGQMGSVARSGLPVLESLADSDPDPKVRETAVKMLNKLRIRFGLVPAEAVAD
ncbi:MAG: HEAT repeat domain-containing protein [Planctomycetes bacterium]|nr:HEAT repeat domain-containing protein [Planctomycetota bacterium]